MFKYQSFFVAGLVVLSLANISYGWGGPTHALLCQRNFDVPVVAAFLGGVDQSAIENYIGEPDGHSGQWIGIRDRYYIDTAGSYSGFSYNALGETERLQALQHHCGDVAVPAHHAPAVYEYDSQWAEGLCEAAAVVGYTSVGELPNVTNSCNYTHSQNGHSYSFTGTIDQVVDTFEDACRDNAAWYKSTMYTLFGKSYHWPSDIASANWNGLKISLMLQRAVFVDYFLAQQSPVANANGSYAVNPGGSVSFSSTGSQDPDSVSWASNGTYSNNGGGFSCLWDFNNDGTYETSGASPNLSHSQLVGLTGYTEGKTISLRVTDDEGKVAHDTATLAVYSNPTADAHGDYSVYEGGSVQFSGSGGDADGGSVSFAWDRDNNGSFETSQQNPTFGYGAWTPSETGHTVVLRVTDNESVAETDTATV
ncbi:MAG: PKD domain-containing protein, partial [Phycisphaerae bacterium]|nr:PKD domain-containing protein [Phycisphaerae bacterium]